jgi:thiol-disulfide isomerase/thioredoxin
MKRYYILAVVFVLIIGLVVWLESKKVRISGSVGVPAISLGETENNKAAEKAKIYDSAKEIVSPAGFINTDENLQIKNLIGKKVVLLDFWTYSCINCQRTLPYITSWYDKYKDAGLEIIGVHTPEFAFEKEYDNVVAATKKWGVNYPVVLDNDYGTWQAYKNRYWPRKYLIDIDGYIVYDHIGEGGYDETEKKIQELLMETG